MPKKQLADTRTEAEEARWFEQNQSRILRLFEQAEREGALRISGKSIGITVSKRTGALLKPRSQKVMLRIPTDDLDRARRLAGGKGLGYQTYMKMLLREGMDREERRARRTA
jgi:predicted DNA binding CopG/RHH family protein